MLGIMSQSLRIATRTGTPTKSAAEREAEIKNVDALRRKRDSHALFWALNGRRSL